MPIGKDYMVGAIPGTDVHWGCWSAWSCAVCPVGPDERGPPSALPRDRHGGNPRAALAQGLPVGTADGRSARRLPAPAPALPAIFEVAAIHGQANASLIAGYGFTGILVAFLARHNPMMIVPVAIMFGAIEASGGLIQRRMDMPDATALVLQGIIFVVLLVSSETFYGRFCYLPAKGGARSDMTASYHHSDRDARRRHQGLDPVHVRQPRRNADREIRPHQSRPRRQRWCFGAMSGYAISYHTGSPWLGVLVAGLLRRLPSARCTAIICKLPKVNDIAIGIALMLVRHRLAFFFGKPYIQPSAPRLESLPLGGWSDPIPRLQQALEINPLFLRRHR
jgi:ABC-type uncharacterized transport system permease subunit